MLNLADLHRLDLARLAIDLEDLESAANPAELREDIRDDVVSQRNEPITIAQLYLFEKHILELTVVKILEVLSSLPYCLFDDYHGHLPPDLLGTHKKPHTTYASRPSILQIIILPMFRGINPSLYHRRQRHAHKADDEKGKHQRQQPLGSCICAFEFLPNEHTPDCADHRRALAECVGGCGPHHLGERGNKVGDGAHPQDHAAKDAQKCDAPVPRK